MKKTSILPSLMILCSALLLTSCSALNSLTMSVVEPAPVFLPDDTKSAAILNRSLPNEKDKTLDDVDKILTIEGKNLDKKGAEEAIVGLKDELVRTGKFNEVKVITDHPFRSAMPGTFPPALPWTVVDSLCKANNVDVLFVLSFYDTDAQVDYKTNPVEVQGPLGISATLLEHSATITTMIKTGWRIYDPRSKTIWDEYPMAETVVSSGKGINPLKAIEAVVGREDAVMQVSNEVGHIYGARIMPFTVRVGRYYYVRGSQNFKIGRRRAIAGDWHGAADLWAQEVNNPKRKVAGRACYNMAIINEIDGNLQTAVDWATKSYVDYNNKEALEYLNILKYRLSQVR